MYEAFILGKFHLTSKIYRVLFCFLFTNDAQMIFSIMFFFLQLFRGNDDADTPVEGELDCPVFAKGIRIIPLEWESHIALRFDAKGCYVDNSVIGTKHVLFNLLRTKKQTTKFTSAKFQKISFVQAI